MLPQVDVTDCHWIIITLYLGSRAGISDIKKVSLGSCAGIIDSCELLLCAVLLVGPLVFPWLKHAPFWQRWPFAVTDQCRRDASDLLAQNKDA